MIKKLNIILIEDNREHVIAARKQLQEHNLTVFKRFEEFKDWISDTLTNRCTDLGIPLPSEFDANVRSISFASMVTEHDLLPLKNYDILLTDNELPVNSEKVANETSLEKIGSDIVLIGLMLKFPMIGLLTDKNHHEDSHSRIFDCLGAANNTILRIGDSKVFVSNIHMVHENHKPTVKNWGEIVKLLTST